MVIEAIRPIPISDVSLSKPIIQETIPQQSDALDQIVTAVCKTFDGIPEEIFRKYLKGPENESTFLSQQCLTHLLRLGGIDKSQILSLFSVDERSFTRHKVIFANLIKINPKIDFALIQLEESLLWIKKVRDIQKITNQIGEVVTYYTGFSWDEMKKSWHLGRARNKEATKASYIAMHLFREAGVGVAETGMIFGKKDHSTVSNGVKRINKKRGKDKKLDKAILIMETAVEAIAKRRELQEAIDGKIESRQTEPTAN